MQVAIFGVNKKSKLKSKLKMDLRWLEGIVENLSFPHTITTAYT
jgi:hypothetical protein